MPRRKGSVFYRVLLCLILAVVDAAFCAESIHGKSVLVLHSYYKGCLLYTSGPVQYLYSSDAYPGRVYKLSLDGKVLGMLGTSGRQLKEFGWIHEMACPSENTLYVAELLNWRVQKLTLHPVK